MNNYDQVKLTVQAAVNPHQRASIGVCRQSLNGDTKTDKLSVLTHCLELWPFLTGLRLLLSLDF